MKRSSSYNIRSRLERFISDQAAPKQPKITQDKENNLIFKATKLARILIQFTEHFLQVTVTPTTITNTHSLIIFIISPLITSNLLYNVALYTYMQHSPLKFALLYVAVTPIKMQFLFLQTTRATATKFITENL